MILGKWPTWRTILSYVFISILYMFRATSCSSSGESSVSIQHLVLCHSVSVTVSCAGPFRPAHETVIDTDWHVPEVVLIQLISWWWARGCSKHVVNWNKYIEKNCASSWSFTKNDTDKLLYSSVKDDDLSADVVTCTWHRIRTKLRSVCYNFCISLSVPLLSPLIFDPCIIYLTVSNEKGRPAGCTSGIKNLTSLRLQNGSENRT